MSLSQEQLVYNNDDGTEEKIIIKGIEPVDNNNDDTWSDDTRRVSFVNMMDSGFVQSYLQKKTRELFSQKKLDEDAEADARPDEEDELVDDEELIKILKKTCRAYEDFVERISHISKVAEYNPGKLYRHLEYLTHITDVD